MGPPTAAPQAGGDRISPPDAAGSGERGAEAQLGHHPGMDKHERVRELLRRQPRRDEPRIDSVEWYELPPE